MPARAAMCLLLVAAGLAVLSFSPPGATADRAAPTHHCGRLHTFGFPSVTGIRSRGTSCREARGVSRWIYGDLHSATLAEESARLPAEVGPVRRLTFHCRYHGVSTDHDFSYYAARCRSGRSVVLLHLGS
jgi:hypothetical protein